MTGQRKQFLHQKKVTTLTGQPIGAGNVISVQSIPRKESVVVFPRNPSSSRSWDFKAYYGMGFDDITWHCQCVIERKLEIKKNTVVTIYNQCASLKYFFNFCIYWASVTDRDLSLLDITPTLINEFIGYLDRLAGLSYPAQHEIYSQIKSVLVAMSRVRLLPAKEILFPRNPYPGSNARKKGQKGLSDCERKNLVWALKVDLVDIFAERFAGAASEALTICLFAICLRIGRNSTPMLELSRAPLKPHPFKKNRRLIVTYKRRGNATHLTSIEGSRDIDTLSTAKMDVVAIIGKVQKLTAPLVDDAPIHLRNSLWLFRCPATSRSDIAGLTAQSLFVNIRRFIARHDLRGDDGNPLVLNTSRLRKTFVNRLWRLSGGDPFTVARLAGHTVKVSDSHYLEVTPEMERNHRFLGEVLVSTLRGERDDSPTPMANQTEMTPVGRCRDPYYGDRAPKDGQACTDFLSCFRCRSFVVTPDEADLHRLYSFYWLMVRERHRIGSKRWGKLYGWIVRLIDDHITSRFPSDWINAVKQRAKDEPHPFWRDSMLIDGDASL